MKCPSCGSEIEDDAKICLYCYANLEEYTQNQNKQKMVTPQQKGTRKVAPDKSEDHEDGTDSEKKYKLIALALSVIIVVQIIVLITIHSLHSAGYGKKESVTICSEVSEERNSGNDPIEEKMICSSLLTM